MASRVGQGLQNPGSFLRWPVKPTRLGRCASATRKVCSWAQSSSLKVSERSAKAFVELGGSSLDRCLRSGAGQRVDKLARLPVSRGARGGPRQGGGDHAEGGRARREQGHAPKRVGLKNKLDAVTKARGKDLGVDNAPVCCQGRYGNTRLGADLDWIVVRPLVLGDHAGADERRLMCVSGILNKGRRLGGGLAVADLEEAHLRVRQPARPHQEGDGCRTLKTQSDPAPDKSPLQLACGLHHALGRAGCRPAAEGKRKSV